METVQVAQETLQDPHEAVQVLDEAGKMAGVAVTVRPQAQTVTHEAVQFGQER